MKTILFPTDFSENAENAMHFALELASKINARLILLHVFPVPYDFASRQAEAMEKMEKYAGKRLKNIIVTIKGTEQFKNINCQELLKTGNIIHSISDAAMESKADIIVMSTKGASGIQKLMFGSNTAEVIRRSPVPVLAIPEKADFHQIVKIACAVDYQNDDLTVLKEVATLAAQLNVGLETVHVASEENLHEQILHRGLTELIREKLSFINATHQLLFHKSFFKGMEDYLNANPGTLLTLAHYRRPLIDSLLHRSICQEMAYQTRTPVLIYNLQGDMFKP